MLRIILFLLAASLMCAAMTSCGNSTKRSERKARVKLAYGEHPEIYWMSVDTIFHVGDTILEDESELHYVLVQ